MPTNYEDLGDEPPTFSEDLAFYQAKPDKRVVMKTLTNPVPGPDSTIGRSDCFSVTPAIVHFGGLKVGEVHEQIVSIVNISKTSQRLSIYPASSSEFRAEYEKQGSLAPGMSQKVTIMFRPLEYKYYHDYVKVQTEGNFFILVPLHAYPVLNKLDFPRNISFGNSPLCEPGKRIVTLKCSVPVDFSFDIEVVKPHPYFRIEPLKGIIPAKGEVNISITFMPITLGSCFLSMKLHVGQYGWLPIECDVSAKAVSGLLESRELKQAEARLMDYINATGEVINNTIGPNSSFRGDLSFKADPATTVRFDSSANMTAKRQQQQDTILLQHGGAKNHLKDPTASLLASTFRASDLNTALDAVLQNPDFLGTRVNNSKNVNSTGIRGVDGVLKSTLPVKARGVGSGIVFDAGAQWATLKQAKTYNRVLAGTHSPTKLMPQKYEDTLVEGLRIPPNLDSFPAVNFVITQEPGKLKPKDLKVAIERNRADRELRAAEQAKIREEGGGAGLLDIRGILAEERLNLIEGDSFKRQLREMAFLADVDDVEKQEAVKQFRISEEFLGSAQLSEHDIELVYKQRSQAFRHKQRSNWRIAQARQHTAVFPPTDGNIKAGASADVAKQLTQTLTPSFDTNRNDVWSKRMNTLRKLISYVSRWIVRKRLDARMGKVMRRFEGITTKEAAKEFIAQENADAKAAGPAAAASSSGNAKNDNNASISAAAADVTTFTSVADMVCTAPSDAVVRRQNNDKIIATSRYEFTANMARRVLFPKFVAEESSTRSEMKPVSIDVAPAFDDRTFFQLKSRPEFVAMGYLPHKAPATSLTFGTARGVSQRLGAAEEAVLRPAADLFVKVLDLQLNIPPEPPALEQLRPPPAVAGTDAAEANFSELDIATPEWLTATPTWPPGELDFFRTRPDYRAYVQPPSRSEKDDDWILRPFSEQLEYDEDSSLRSMWQRTPGFLAVNRYLLGGHETRNTDPPPPCGPTIIDFYMPDSDRHLSGLNCFARDHLRSITEDDPDVAPLQAGQDTGDVLTDSESDDDDGYVAERPSIARARKIFRDVSAATQQDDALPSSPGQFSLESDGFGMLSPTKRRDEQVELMRDRKTLDLESSLVRARQDHESAVAKRLVEVSKASKCLLSALPVQLPLHTYQDEILSPHSVVDWESIIPPVLTAFVQAPSSYDGTLSPTRQGGGLNSLAMSIESPS